MRKHHFVVLSGLMLMFSTATVGQTSAQTSRSRTEDSAFMKAGPVRDAMDRLEKQADNFEDRLGDAIDRSSYDRRSKESLMRWADMVEDEVDDMVKEFKNNNTQKYIRHFENAMLAASAINRAMLRKDFSAGAESVWRNVREDLNHIATQLHRPVLPNVTVVVIAPAAPTLLAAPAVRQVMEQLEASTDRFEDSLKKSLQHSTANMTRRERVWNDWADYLEDTTDDMLEEYKEKDVREFQTKLERTLMVADAMNRLMLRSDLSPDTESQWKTVRGQINAVASAFNYPVVTDLNYNR